MTDDTSRDGGHDRQQGERPAAPHTKRPAKTVVPPVAPGTTFEQLIKKALNTPPPPKTNKCTAK